MIEVLDDLVVVLTEEEFHADQKKDDCEAEFDAVGDKKVLDSLLQSRVPSQVVRTGLFFRHLETRIVEPDFVLTAP